MVLLPTVHVTDADPDQHGSAWIRIKFSCWIRFHIQNEDPDPDLFVPYGSGSERNFYGYITLIKILILTVGSFYATYLKFSTLPYGTGTVLM